MTALLASRARSETARTRIHELSAMAEWGVREWLEHFVEEESTLIPLLQKHPDSSTRAAARTIVAQHDGFRRVFATGRMPPRSALLAHALFEERAFKDAGLIAV